MDELVSKKKDHTSPKWEGGNDCYQVGDKIISVYRLLKAKCKNKKEIIFSISFMDQMLDKKDYYCFLNGWCNYLYYIKRWRKDHLHFFLHIFAFKWTYFGLCNAIYVYLEGA